MRAPEFIDSARPEQKAFKLEQAKGKTISAVEFGEEYTHPKVHQAEAIVLHFSDGTALSITVGSNVQNVEDQLQKGGLEPKDISTDLMVSWLDQE
ncbi:MAG: hypothetical protein ABFD64_07460 [Armatimonadota bacterium]